MQYHLGIHHHFKFERKFLNKPGYFKDVKFEQIPFFKLYPKFQLRCLRDVIDVLSSVAMPHKYQKIMAELLRIKTSHYREELITPKYCAYNKQSFFVRVYQLRQKNFVKVEIVVHSQTLGEGKYYDLDKAYRAAVFFFNRLEENLIPLSLDLHLDEYFLPEEFKKIVSDYNKELKHIKQTKNPSTKAFLIEKLKEDLIQMEESSKEITKVMRREVRSEGLIKNTEVFRVNHHDLLQNTRSMLTKIIHANS